MITLTKRQKQIYDFIKSYISKHGFSPTFEEIRRHFKLSAISTVHQHIKALANKNFLTKGDGLARSIELKINESMTQIPLLGTIAAGQPIEAITTEELISVPRTMLSFGGKHYALRVEGDSMIKEGIFDGDTVIIRHQDIVNNGETAVALINGNEATLKKIYFEKGRIRLQPANPSMKPIYSKSVTIQGKVVGVLRKY